MGVVMAQLSQAEIARRLPLWCALSDIFLDTELEPDDYRSIAQAICRSGFTLQQAEEVFRNEVAPAFAINLWNVAGEWQGWTEDYVRERVLAKRQSLFARLTSWLLNRSLLDCEWAKISNHFGS